MPEHRGGAARDLRRRQDLDDQASSPGIYFADDPAFKGQQRELTAADYVYSWKRVLDPEDALDDAADASTDRSSAPRRSVAKAKETGKFDYDAPIEGLQAIDRYTIRIKLDCAPTTSCCPTSRPSATAAVAREVVEAYARRRAAG